MIDTSKYTVFVSALSEEDGGGFLARVPDLPGCMGDGETKEDAIRDAESAIVEWIQEYDKMGREVPPPGSFIEEARNRRDDELKLLMKLRDALRENESDFASLETRIDALERDVQYLIDILGDADAWERFAIITKSRTADQKELFYTLLS